MVDIKTLLPELRALVTELGEDMLARVTVGSETDAMLRTAYQQIKGGGRTAQSYEEWREDYLDQVAVAWVLGCIFVRFIEDNDLIDECYLAGEGDRRKLAEGQYEIYFRSHPHDTDREYLKDVFTQIGKLPAARELFEVGKTPLWAVDPSGDAARRLLAYFREIDAERGGLKRTFGTPRTTTQPLVDVYQGLAPQARFLGDLYQDLSEHARKKYALLQTPEFVETFILDRTLDEAIREFGLRMYVDHPKRPGEKKAVPRIRIIDPTCGSGHFLLDAFSRLVSEWNKPEYGIDNATVAAQNALDSIFGVDINSFAIAITRFRLLVAAVQACGFRKLNQQTYAWKINLAVGDSLLRGSKPTFNNERAPIFHQQEFDFEPDPRLAIDDPTAANEILGQGYHVVVGNPPYITPKDKAQNEAYRENYPKVCHRQYSLGVPFTQRFWDLTIRKGERVRNNSDEVSTGSGHVGMITANSFMKREFGKKLIEEFFPKIDFTHIIDTSGAYIPGHGTPTVILFGRARKPVGDTVRAVLGIKGEPSTPAIPAKGLVWQSIVKQIDRAGAQDEFTSTADVPRETFAKHPWSIGGGGAADLKCAIEEGSECRLDDSIELIGYICMTRADDIYFAPRAALNRAGFAEENIVHLVEGDVIRDWSLREPSTAIFPYDSDLKPVEDSSQSPVIRFLWPYRTILWLRQEIGGTQKELGMTWHEWNRFQRERFRLPRHMAFAFVATHNHFVLDRGGKVFKQSAPIIKLPTDATEDDHLSLLGPLNSSTGCFWMKQNFQTKGSSGIGRGVYDERWESFYEHTGTGLERFPIPEQKPLALARQLDKLGQQYARLLPVATVQAAKPTAERLADARTQAKAIWGLMIALQEELDWQCYHLYGLLPDDLRYTGDNVPELALGQRAFEIVMARKMAEGDLQTSWFERHGSNPITEIPTLWPPAYHELVERRIKVIETNKEIRLIEKPEYKRRWNTEPWAEQEQRALENWLLDRLEDKRYWPSVDPQSTARLADRASSDAEFMQVAALYRGRPDFDVAVLVAELVEGESVPFLPVLRYKATGLRKRAVWERTWELQRQEDAGVKVGDIPVPPKYATADFVKTDFWRLRGKLDVPKERWISYPHCHTDSDPSLLVGWAGWDHLQQAGALVGYYDARKREGWDAKRLTPLLAGLAQLLPWVHQWHPEIVEEFGESAGKSYQTLLEQDAHELGLTLDDIRNWQPPEKARKIRVARKKQAQAEDDE
jgi:hypothetical protein